MYRRIRKWLVRGLLLIAGAVAVLGVIAYGRRVELAAWGIVSAPNREAAAAAYAEPSAVWLVEQGVSQVLRVEVGPPRAELSVWIVEPQETASGGAARGTLFFLHGIRDRKESMLGPARAQARRGYRCVLIDARGHGRSRGDFLSYGVWEAHDYAQVLDELERRGLVAGRVGAYGMSYGAGCALQWAGSDPRVAAVVAVAPFSSLRRAVYGYAHLTLPFVPCPPGGWLDEAIVRAGAIGGYDPNAADGAAALGKTRAHVLFIHGRDDAKLSWHESERLLAALPDAGKLMVLENEGHDSITLDRNGLVFQNESEWFDRWVGDGAALTGKK